MQVIDSGREYLEQAAKEPMVLGSVRGCLVSILILVDNMVRQGLFTILCLHNMWIEIFMYYIVFSPRVLRGTFLYKDEYHSFFEYFYFIIGDGKPRWRHIYAVSEALVVLRW